MAKDKIPTSRVGRTARIGGLAAGQAIPGGRPDYRRVYLVPFADRIRNEAGLVTVVGGNVASRDDVNTILAAGRADLCLVDPRIYAGG